MRRGLLVAVAVTAIAAGLLAGPASGARKGGTLKGMFASDVDFVDPSLAYYVHSWQVMGAVGANLVRVADAEGAAGSRLVPEVAARFPSVSRDGRTYTFALRRSFRFSDAARTPVTAQSFAWAIQRALDPRAQSPAGAFVGDIVGARAVQDGKARTPSGVRVLGPYRLQIRLARPAPDILTRLAMPFFMAMDRRLHPTDAKGVPAPMHAAGPYYVASWAPNSRLVVRRNPAYRGTRAANVNAIE